MYKISDEVIKFIEILRKTAESNWQRKEKNWGENPGRGLPGRFAITITIRYNGYATESHRKCIDGYKLHKSFFLNQPPNAHGRYQTVCQKWKRIGNPKTGSKDIQWRYWDRIWHRKCAMRIMKSGKQQMTKERELSNQLQIRMLGEKEA